MNAPIISDNTDDREPIIADAIPATCPIGSIAMAFRFPKTRPKLKNKIAAYIKNIQSSISTIELTLIKIAEEIVIAKKEPIQIVFIPSFATKCEFISDATPRTNAKHPK